MTMNVFAFNYWYNDDNLYNHFWYYCCLRQWGGGGEALQFLQIRLKLYTYYQVNPAVQLKNPALLMNKQVSISLI